MSTSMKLRVPKFGEILEQFRDCQLLKEDLHQKKKIKTVLKPSFTAVAHIIQCYPQIFIKK
jgi:thioredoxin-related protein